MSSWNTVTQQWTAGTGVPAVVTPTFGHSCVMTSIAGCDHFGVSAQVSGSNIIYRWLVADPANPGTLVRFGTDVAIPHPTVSVIPPAVPGDAPQVAFEIRVPAPPPPEIPKPELQFGEAKWVRVYKTEVQREVVLDELLGDNPIVPQDPGKVETNWKLLQFNPHSENSGVLRNQGGINSGSRAVIRRYEFYKFSGGYDAASHKAVCGGDGLCNAPLDGELGDFIGSQMAAANVGVPSLTITGTSSLGSVTSADRIIRCGSACTSTYPLNAVVTLTAVPSKGTFVGWTGGCAGTQLTCDVTINDAITVGAKFTQFYSLAIAKSGTGTVTGPQINCGTACLANFAEGSVVALTASSAAGTSVVWGGSCSGSALTCTVTISRNTSVQAKFK